MIALLPVDEAATVVLFAVIAALLVVAIPVALELRRRPLPVPEAEHTPAAWYRLPIEGGER